MTASRLILSHWSHVSRSWADVSANYLNWMRLVHNSSGLAPTIALESCREMIPPWTDIITIPPVSCSLGVASIPDLDLAKHKSIVGDKCFFQLRELRRIRRSLEPDSPAWLIYALNTSRIDCCNWLFAGVQKMDRQASASSKCSCASFDRIEQIRPSTHWNLTHRLAPAGCSKKVQVQTGPHGIPVPSWNGTAIPLRTVHPGRTDPLTT